MTTTSVPACRRWRAADLVAALVIGVAGGLAFWGWDHVWAALEGPFAGYPPGEGFIYGVWLAPGVVGALVVRKPGAALCTELVAAVVEALLGSTWGLSVIAYGFVEGLAPDVVFAVFAYRMWRLPVALLAGAVAGLSAAVLDFAYYHPDWAGSWKLSYAALVAASSALVAGAGGVALVAALARSGIPGPLASRRRAPTPEVGGDGSAVTPATRRAGPRGRR